MMSLWDALRMNMMISYQELVRTFPNIATLMPNNLVLKQFHKITEPWFEAILLNEYKLTSLASLRDTLLPKLISGELSLEDLPDLNTDTEAA